MKYFYICALLLTGIHTFAMDVPRVFEILTETQTFARNLIRGLEIKASPDWEDWECYRDSRDKAMYYHPTTPLIEAQEKGDFFLFNKLLEEGADPNKESPLYLSSPLSPLSLSYFKHSSIQFTKALLEHGANPNGVDKEGRTELYKAILVGSLAHVQCLLDHGADPSDLQDEDKLLDSPFTKEKMALIQEARKKSRSQE